MNLTPTKALVGSDELHEATAKSETTVAVYPEICSITFLLLYFCRVSGKVGDGHGHFLLYIILVKIFFEASLQPRLSMR